MKRIATLSVVAAGLYLVTGLAGAADQTILGRSLIVKNPGNPDKRKIAGSAKESASPNTITGDPTLAGSAGGAILTVIANGANPTTQTFTLAQGTTSSGKPFWRTGNTTGFKYKDGRGEQGPVKSVIIRRTAGGIFSIKVVAKAKNGPITVVPPDPGTDGFVTLQIAGGDRYCVQFGPDGKVQNKNSQLFKVRRPQLEGCPGGASTTTTAPTTSTTSTTTSSTTSTTIYSSPSKAFLDRPIDLLD
jgi:hypothetical protein